MSATQAELFSVTLHAQDMVYMKRIFESIKLKVELRIILEMDNKGTLYLVNNVNVGGRTRHIETMQCYLQEFKAQGILIVKSKVGVDMIRDIYMHNLPWPDFERHTRVWVGEDE
jgi:hypothetical protein